MYNGTLHKDDKCIPPTYRCSGPKSQEPYMVNVPHLSSCVAHGYNRASRKLYHKALSTLLELSEKCTLRIELGV
jgi:hypothetical protein